MGSPASKLPDEGLRAFLDGGDDEKRTVLVELDAPTPRMKFDRSPGSSRPIGFADTSPEEEQAAARRERSLAELLTEVTGSPPRYLRAAKAFVVELTPSQLERVVGSDLVRAVRENRRLSR